jgi:hypothetical protein
MKKNIQKIITLVLAIMTIFGGFGIPKTEFIAEESTVTQTGYLRVTGSATVTTTVSWSQSWSWGGSLTGPNGEPYGNDSNSWKYAHRTATVTVNGTGSIGSLTVQPTLYSDPAATIPVTGATYTIPVLTHGVTGANPGNVTSGTTAGWSVSPTHMSTGATVWASGYNFGALTGTRTHRIFANGVPVHTVNVSATGNLNLGGYSIYINPANPASNGSMSTSGGTIATQGASITGGLIIPVTYTMTEAHEPTITATDHNLLLTDTLPDINFTDGVEPRSGATNTLFTGYGGGTYGGGVAFVDDAGLTAGTPATKVGSYTQTIKATDLADPAPKPGFPLYTAEATAQRTINVSTLSAPGVNVVYSDDGTIYSGEWLTTNTSADINKRRTLDVTADTDMLGDYELTTKINGAFEGTSTRTFNSKTTSTIEPNTTITFSSESPSVSGVPATAVVHAIGDTSTTLSTETAPTMMFFDNSSPNPPIVTDGGGWATITTSTTDNGFSGIPGTNGYYYQFVPSGTVPTVPSGNDIGWTSTDSYALPTTLGSYDLYVYAKDNATNRSTATLANSTAIIIADTSILPTLDATYVDANGTRVAYTPSSGHGTGWVNTIGGNVEVTVTPPGGFVFIPDFNSAIYEGGTYVAKGAADSDYTHSYSSQTGLSGIIVTGQLVTGVLNTPVSGESTPAFTVKIDNTAPTTAITSSDDWTTNSDASSDSLSGVHRTYVNFVEVGSIAPTYTSAGWQDATLASLTTPGAWTVYAYTEDNAGNRSTVAVAEVNVIIESTEKALISGTYVDDSMVTQNYVPGTWVNKDITLEVEADTSNDIATAYYSAIYDSAAIEVGKAFSPYGSYTQTFTAETPLTGADYRGLLVTIGSEKLSDYSNPLNIRIDKTAPTPNVIVNTSTWQFTDSSTDALSGVDISKTKVAIVPKGDIPVASDYESIATATLPTTGYWDVWSMATDNAGNESVGAKIYPNIAQSEEDFIDADNVIYEISGGALTDTQIKALASVIGDYYGQDPSTILQSDIEVDSTELAAINAVIAAGETGILDLTFTTPTVNPPNPDPTKSASKTIKVYLVDAVIGNVAWSGKDFNLQLSDVNDINIKNASEVKAYDITDLDDIVEVPQADITVTHSITTIGNAQAIAFEALSTNYGVQANIFDSYNPLNKEGLNANDFTVALIETNNTAYKTASGVVGWDVSSPSSPVLLPITDVNVDSSYIYPIVVTPAHNVDFVTTNGTSITVKATVIASNITVTANDIVIDLATAQAMTAGDLLLRTSASGTTTNVGGNPVLLNVSGTELAKLTDLTTAQPQGITVQINATDAITDSTVKAVRVYVYDSIAGNVGWVGNNFNLALEDVSDENIKEASELEAYDITIPSSPVQIPLTDITVTHSITTIGNGQPVTFETQGEQYNVVGNIFEEYNKTTKEGINANDFIIDVPNVNEANYKIESGVVAWDVSNPGSPVQLPASDIAVDSSYNYPTKATPEHDVTFVTVKGTKKNVKVTVYTVLNLVDNEAMDANDFVIELGKISELELIAAAGAKAYDISIIPGIEIGPVTISTPLPTTTGAFLITFVSPTGKTSVTVNVTVTPNKPEINPIYPGDEPVISGEGTPGNKITITFPDGSTKDTIVEADGTWEIESPVTLNPGDEIKAIATDLGTNTDSEEATKLVGPNKPTINPIGPGKEPEVCGTGTEGNEITVTFPDGSQLKVIVGTDGTWCVTSPIELAPGDEIKIEQEDSDTGEKSEEGKEVVRPEKPTINPINPGEESVISGEGTPGNEITVTFPDGSQEKVIVEPDGNWSVISPVPLNPGTEITAEETDTNTGKVSEKEVEVVRPTKPVINPINPGEESVISGEGTPGNEITVTFPDGSQEKVVIDSDGNWSVISPVPLNPGTEITAEETDANTGKVSEKEVEVVRPTKPIINPINPGEESVISGEGTPGNEITVTFPDGSQEKVVVETDGSWNVISPVPLNPGTEITVEETDANTGKVSEKEVAVVNPANPIINPINPGEAPEISGEGAPGNKIVITLPDGSQIETEIDADGKWSITSPMPLGPGDTITVIEKDANGSESNPVLVVVNDEIVSDEITTYSINGNNIAIPLSSFNHENNAGNLENYIIKQAEVKAYEHNNGVTREVGPVTADTTVFNNMELSGSRDFEIEISYDPTTGGPIVRSAALNAQANEALATAVNSKIIVTITDDTSFISGLPITGEQAFEVLLIALLTLISSFIVLLVVRKKRYANRQ